MGECVCVMVLSAIGCFIFVWGCATVFVSRVAGGRPFLGPEHRASDLAIPRPTPGLEVGVDYVSAVTHTTTCSGGSIIM